MLRSVITRDSLLGGLIAFWLSSFLSCAVADDTNAPARGQEDRVFTDSAPYGAAAEITRHLGYKVALPDYDLKKEKFRVIVPGDYSTNGSWGLLVWVSPEDHARLPAEWPAELAQHKLLLACAYKSGNDRHPLDRFRLALDATYNMCREYRIDRRRIYIGGFSGGSRVASMLGVGYGDLFTGALCACGVNYYRTVRGPDGEEYAATFAPDPSVWENAKRNGRFVLLTGDTDFNRASTKVLSDRGFKRDGFRNVLYLEVRGMGHAMPSAATLREALDYLDGQSKKR